MPRTALCEWALKKALSFSSVIDFSSEKYIVVTGNRYSWYQQMKIRYGPRGTQSFDTQEGPSTTPNFTPNVLSSFCQKTKKYKKGLQIPYDRHNILQISENCLH